MEFKVGQTVFFLEEGDLTLQETEAIVNAANSRLAGGAEWTGRSTGPGARLSWRNAVRSAAAPPERQ